MLQSLHGGRESIVFTPTCAKSRDDSPSEADVMTMAYTAGSHRGIWSSQEMFTTLPAERKLSEE